MVVLLVGVRPGVRGRRGRCLGGMLLLLLLRPGRRLSAARGLLVRATTLVRLRAPSAAAVEARRGPAEGGPAAAEAGGGAAAGLTGARVGGAGAVVVVGAMVRVLEAEDVAVVGGAAGGVREERVRLGEEGEGGGGGGVGGVGVGVVRLGEGVEGPAVFCRSPVSTLILRFSLGSSRRTGRSSRAGRTRLEGSTKGVGSSLLYLAGRGIMPHVQPLVVVLPRDGIAAADARGVECARMYRDGRQSVCRSRRKQPGQLQRQRKLRR